MNVKIFYNNCKAVKIKKRTTTEKWPCILSINAVSERKRHYCKLNVKNYYKNFKSIKTKKRTTTKNYDIVCR